MIMTDKMPSRLRGKTLTCNYRCGIVAKGILWMVFCHMLFCSVCAARLMKYIRINI